MKKHKNILINLHIGEARVRNKESLECDVRIISGSHTVTLAGAHTAAQTVQTQARNSGGTAGSDWYSAGETIDTKCNSISHLTMSVGKQESLVLPGPEALTPVSKHLPYLSSWGLCACQ